MPPSNNDIHSRIEALERKVDEHIHDGISVWKAIEEVKTDLCWIKRALWTLVGLGMTFNGLLVKFMLSHMTF